MSTQPPHKLSSEERQKIINAAIQAKQWSYSPYSKFRVGCALLAENGDVIKGANIENASYGGTICAERTAIVKAASKQQSEGIRQFRGLAVTTDVPSTISPCGICRQVLREFCALNMPILLVASNYDEAAEDGKTILETTLDELLPHSFGPEHLELPRS